MKKPFTLLFNVTVLAAATLPAQTGTTRSLHFPATRHYLALNLTQLVNHQVQVTYGRRVSEKWALEGEAGAKWRWPLNADFYEMTEPFSAISISKESRSLRLHNMPFSYTYYAGGWATRYLFANRPRVQPYLTMGLFYRYSYYENQRIHFEAYNNMTSKYVGSEYRTNFGLRMLAGWRIAAWQWGKKAVIVDPYLALGTQGQFSKEITKNIPADPDTPARSNSRSASERRLTAHLGIKAGFAW